jgi:TolB-like protein/cytochrome c-type biogenesis protein CcmH/NrfG
MGRDEQKAMDLLQTNRQIQKSLVEKYNGRWIKEMGDGTLVQFDSAYNAALCAIEIQQNAKKELKAQLRIGLHLGEITMENDDIFGDGVNVASRIESIADPGGIYISEAIQKALHNRTDVHTRFLGDVLLKNVDDPVKIYCVEGEGLTIPEKAKIKRLREVSAIGESKVKRFFKHQVFYFLIILLVLGFFTIRTLETAKHVRKVQSIAILPFQNFTGSSDEAYFVDMMHDAVISEISKIGNLIVKSRTSTMQFRDSKLSVPEIAKILNVDAIVESSVFKTGDSVYLQVQLISTRPVEDHIWAQDYKRDTRHILSLYGDLAKTVAREVDIQLTPQEDKYLTHKEEVDPEAYKAYLNGQFHWNKLSKEGMDSAEYYYNISREIDPKYALAYAGLASVALVRAQFGIIPYYEAAIDNIKFLEKALALDSTHFQIHFLLAGFNAWGTWDFQTAEAEFIKSITLNPNSAMSRIYYAQLLCILQRYTEARVQAEYAMQLDPYNDVIKAIYAMCMNFMRSYDEAFSVLNEMREKDPYNGIMLSTLRTTCHLTGEYQKAIEVWKDSYIKDSTAYMVLDEGYKKGGYQFALEQLGELMVKRSETEFITPWRISTIYTRAGNKPEAISWMEKAFLAHDQNMPFIATDPIFDLLKGDPKFETIVKRMNFPAN